MARIDNDSPLSNRIIFYFGFCSIGVELKTFLYFLKKKMYQANTLMICISREMFIIAECVDIETPVRLI
jgi:hypothetical protein